MAFFDLKGQNYKDCFIVLGCILLSKSLYYETYGDNLLLGGFIVFLIFCYNPANIKFNKWTILYSFFFVILVLFNTEFIFSSFLVLCLRLTIAIYVVNTLNFKTFSEIFISIVLLIVVLSLVSILVIYFDISSPLPDFIGVSGRPLRNFIFFGVWENFVTYSVIRNSGLWWEPGAFQIFINIAFIFSLLNNSLTRNRYLIFFIGILSTVSTTGVIVFGLLSSILWLRLIKKTEFKLFYISFSLTLLVLFSSFILNFILLKFNGGIGGEASVSFLSRYYDFLISLTLFSENPVLGYGFGNLNIAVNYGHTLLGSDYIIIDPSGSDGLTMFIAQCGMFSFFLLLPLIFPMYYKELDFFSKIIISISIIIMFNTQNFTFILIFTLLSFYGVVGDKNIYKSNKSCVLK